MNDLQSRLTKLGITLPAVSGPFGAYVPTKRVGRLIYVSGQLPMKDGKLIATGHVPTRCAIEQAKAGARQCIINALAAVAATGGLGDIVAVVRVGVFVNSDADFIQQPQVANGASDLLLELFGEAGKHVRAAVGVNTLPLDAAVEVECIFSLDPC